MSRLWYHSLLEELTSESVDRTGQIIDGKYRLQRVLGEGGMATVYVAEHCVIGKRVAVKFLHRDFAARPEVVSRFHDEARAAAAIGHPSIIDVHDVGTMADGEPYLVMEYLSGRSLREVLDRQRVQPIGFAAAVAVRVLSALAAAHRKGIVHRDVKPDNIFLLRAIDAVPIVKLLDFGISKMGSLATGSRTVVGEVLGTLEYMAPEQARGEKTIDARVDLWAM